MSAVLLRRLITAIPVLFLVSIVTFTLVRIVPGDLAEAKLGSAATPEAVAQLRHDLGIDRPLLEQYGDWLSGVLRGDFGESLVNGESVGHELWNSVPPTLEIAILAMAVSLLIGIPIGVMAALNRETAIDYAGRMAAAAGLALPGFWIALVALTLLARYADWVPPLQYRSLTSDPIENLKLVGIPTLVIGFGLSGIVIRLTRAAMLEVLDQDYVLTARSKGLSRRMVVTRHALKNALIPVITVVGVQLGFLLGSVVIMEQIFAVPGLGRLTFEAINGRDYPTIQAAVLLMAIIFVVVNFVIDIVYVALDPRIRV